MWQKLPRQYDMYNTLLCFCSFDPSVIMHCVVGQRRQVSVNASSLGRPETSGEAVKTLQWPAIVYHHKTELSLCGREKKDQ